MPDKVEVKQEAKPGEQPGAAPAIDLEQFRADLKKDIAETVQQYMSTEDKDAEVKPTAYVAPEAHANPMQSLIDPIIQPHLRRLEAQTAAAQDAAIFYASTPEAAKYRDEIEKGFNQMLSQGSPVARAGIWDWYKGKNQQKFIDAAIKDHDSELQKAKEAEDAATGHGPGGKARQTDAYTMTEEELGKALENVSF